MLLALGALSAACTSPTFRPVAEDYSMQRPAVDLRLGGAGRVVEAEEVVESESPRWTLERCVRRALDANRRLLDADAQVASAGYSLVAAEAEFQVQIQPRIFSALAEDGTSVTGADVSVRKLTRNGTILEFAPTITKSDGEFESGYRASITQPLLRGRQRDLVESTVNSARFDQRSAARARYIAEVDVVLATIQTVYRVIGERESLELIEESAARAEAHVIAATARQRAGLSTSLDLFRATQQRNRIMDSRATALRAFEDATDSLRLLLALPLNAPMEVQAPLEVASDQITLDQAVAIAVGRRVELRQAEDEVNEARRLARVAEINTQLDVDLVLSLGHFGRSGALADSFELSSPQLGVSLASNTDVRRIAEKANYEQAKLRAGVTNRTYRLRRDIVIQEVKRALRRVERGRRSIEIQRAQIEQAEGKLLVARAKFELGATTNFNLVEAEDDLRSAETALIRSVAQTIDSQFELRAALGTLVEIPEELAF